jgi:Flp pilus assembly protein TadD
VGAALLVALAIAIGITPRYRAEALRFAARESMDRMAKSLPTESIVRSRLLDVRAQLERAVEIAPDNARAWSDLSYALVQMGRISPVDKADLLGREAEKAADRAIALCPRVAEFWVRRGGARDLQNRWAEASPDFAQAVVLSPNAVLPWYYYAYHMLLRPIGLDMGQAAVEYCLRLDPTDPDVQALRQRLATTSRSSL